MFGYFVLGLDFWIAVLLGAVTSPTDAAAVFSVLRNVPIPHRLRGALEAESGLNDAPTVLVVMLASSIAIGEETTGGVVRTDRADRARAAGGLAIGIVSRLAGRLGMRRVALPSSGLYPLAALVWSVFAYSSAAMLHTSGFAAVYACALMLGNADCRTASATRSFVEGTGWIAQIGLFVMLGLLASPGRVSLQAVLVGLAGGTVPDPGRPTAARYWRRRLVPGFRFPHASKLPLLGGAPRRGADRAGDHPPVAGGRRRGVPVRRGTRLRHHLHLPAGSHPAVHRPPAGLPRRGVGSGRGGRGGAAGHDFGGSVAGPGARRLPARRSRSQRVATPRDTPWCR